MTCISRKAVTHLISHNQKLQMDANGHSSKEGLLPTVPEHTMVQVMVTVGNSGVIYEEVLHSTVWIATVQDNEHSIASVQNWRSTDGCECVWLLLIAFWFGEEDTVLTVISSWPYFVHW